MIVADRAQSPRPSVLDDGRFVSVIACIVAIVVILVGGHLYGRYLASKEIGGRDVLIDQLQAQIQQQKRTTDQKSAQVSDLQAKLARIQAQLEQIQPSKDTYNILPNQTLIVANGKITIGLIGSPANENILLNVNGKQLAATAGQVIPAGSDAAANCRVAVQSFDMFKAVLTATCAGGKSQ
jgi:uncharacterized coiled-coil protein SlyX